MLPKRLRRPHLPLAHQVVQPEAEGHPEPVHQGRHLHAVSLRSAQRKGNKVELNCRGAKRTEVFLLVNSYSSFSSC